MCYQPRYQIYNLRTPKFILYFVRNIQRRQCKQQRDERYQHGHWHHKYIENKANNRKEANHQRTAYRKYPPLFAPFAQGENRNTSHDCLGNNAQQCHNEIHPPRSQRRRCVWRDHHQPSTHLCRQGLIQLDKQGYATPSIDNRN